MTPAPRTVLLLACLMGAPGACSSQSAGECQLDSDCEMGVCGDNGQCNTMPAADAGPRPDAADDGQVSACGGRIDEEIARNELPMAAGVTANFRVATATSFATAGEEINGQRSWNLDRDFASDEDVVVELFDTDGAWYTESFPDASYAALLSQESELLGVFRLSDEGLYLLGVVSPEEGLTRTELSYDPPALLMPVPLSEGDTWSTDSAITGYASGIYSTYSELYEGAADASGALQSPFGNFRVIRNQIIMTRTLGFTTTKTIQYNFVSACAGIVANLVSEADEDDVDFSEIAELRRLIP